MFVIYEINFSTFHSRTVHLDIIRVFYSPTDAQENCFKNNINIYINTLRMGDANLRFYVTTVQDG